MIRNALLVVTLTCCALIAAAQSFPLWEHILNTTAARPTTTVPTPNTLGA